nr:hypothetical protein [Tanacetum cinerariifolium]
MENENPRRTLGDYSKPSHEVYQNIIEIPDGNNVGKDASAQFFPPGWISKLRNDILMFQQHQGESPFEAWTRFKDLLQKLPHYAGGKLRDKNDEESWALLEDLALNENKSWNDPRDFAKHVKRIYPELQPRELDPSFEAHMQEYMESHLERMKRFKKAIFRQRDEINRIMADMFGLLKELTSSTIPEKVQHPHI